MALFPDHVESQIAFVDEGWRNRDEHPRIYSRASRLANTKQQQVLIRNARPRHEQGELDLDGSGFVLTRHKSTVTEFRDKTVVLNEYFPQMRQLLLELTGAEDALPFPFYQVRSANPAHFFDAYSLYMHCDYSPDTQEKFAQHVVRTNGESYPAEDWDFAFYNLWRPIGAPVEKDPLVVMDASSLARVDIINYHAEKEGKTGLAAVPLYNPQQQFFYVPHMQPDEVLVLKQLDSRPGRALVCPHTSFVDPTAAATARERESIDIRFMCIFPKTGVS